MERLDGSEKKKVTINEMVIEKRCVKCKKFTFHTVKRIKGLGVESKCTICGQPELTVGM